mmetsp:Transcript_26518/g.47614  ORF Transcript_26518/g.47614 Transcript_26518/m.47614 type:complete len:201 (+) Transcript_26518:1954-2556(+)
MRDLLLDFRLVSCSISLVTMLLMFSKFCLDLTLASLKLTSSLYFMMSLKNSPSPIMGSVPEKLEFGELQHSIANALESPSRSARRLMLLNCMSTSDALWSFFFFFTDSKRSISSAQFSKVPLGFGSLGQLWYEWPNSRQLAHFTFPVLFLPSSLSSVSSSSSSLHSCLLSLQPGAFWPSLPQHHHISPPYWLKWILQDQL